MRTYQDYVNEVRSVMGLGPLVKKPTNDLSNELAKLKKELRRSKDKEAVIKQLYNNKVKEGK